MDLGSNPTSASDYLMTLCWGHLSENMGVFNAVALKLPTSLSSRSWLLFHRPRLGTPGTASSILIPSRGKNNDFFLL